MTEQYIEDKERQTKNRHGDDPTATKRVRNYNNKIWTTVGGERDPHRAFIEYVGHRPKGGNVPGNFYPSPVDSPKFNIWYKVVPIGRNTLGKQVQSIASIAPLDCQFTNSSGRKTIIQVLRDDFDPLEISYLRAAWPRQSGIHIQLQPQSSRKTGDCPQLLSPTKQHSTYE